MKTNIKTISKLVGLFVFASSILSCGPSVNATKMTDKDLSTYQTYAYLPNGNFESLERNFDGNKVGEEVINSVNRNMQQEGYTLDRDNPDLLVLVSTSTDRDVNVTQDPVYATYPNYYGSTYGVGSYYSNYYYNGYSSYNGITGYDTDVNVYQEGNLMVSVVDKDTKNVVWKASAGNIISQDDTSEAIAKYVDDIFKEYPAKKGV